MSKKNMPAAFSVERFNKRTDRIIMELHEPVEAILVFRTKKGGDEPDKCWICIGQADHMACVQTTCKKLTA